MPPPTAADAAPMRVHRFFAAVASSAFAAVLLYFIRDAVAPPYSDSEFKANITDTWVPYALTSVAIGTGVVILSLATGLGAWRARARVRRLFLWVTVLGIASLVAVVVVTDSVTRAAERASGYHLSVL